MKKVLIALALIVAGIYPLINSVSLFTSTHDVFSISSIQNDVNCTSCHPYIADELANSAYHKSLSCEDCHRNPYLGQNVAIDNGTITPGKEAHAAVKPRCLDCHSKTSITLANGTTVLVTPAKAFNETNYGSYYSAHKQFVMQAKNYDLAVGENEACLACHTNFTVKISFKRPLFFNFTVSNWNVTINQVGNTNTTIIFKGGSGAKHEFKSLSKIDCIDCHSDIWTAINHTEPSPSGNTPNSSHVIWYWDRGKRQAPIHNISNIGTSYTNITDYCLSSCHNPQVSGTNIPPELVETVHVARRLSCYSCHNTNGSAQYSILDKTSGLYNFSSWSPAMDELDINISSSPLIIHGDTCISCKRDGAPNSGTFITYSEPSNLMYNTTGQI